MGYDIIGDVHGHNERLEALLQALGYQQQRGAWRHASRTAIFVGDLIDRGPGQLATLELVRAMVDAGTAQALMGNHEFNAIAWASPDPEFPGQYLRPRHGDLGRKNRSQHEAFLGEVEGDRATHDNWIAWFMQRPLWIETPAFRVVHACWSPQHIDALRPHLLPGERLSDELVTRASRPEDTLFDAVETLLKGAETPLPPGYSFRDKDGHERRQMRLKWWDPTAATYREAYLGPSGVTIPDLPLDEVERIPEADRPTFVGHYWMPPNGPFRPVSDRVACVDFSAGHGGPLVAYRFDGEEQLSDAKMVAV